MGFFSKILGGNTISAREAHQRMEQGGSHVLLDVRTPEEYRQVRIKDAKLIPVVEIESRAPVELPDKNIPILVYCHSGARAGSAVRILTSMGYTNVQSFGGIMNWPYNTVRG